MILRIVPDNSISVIRHKVHNEVQIDFLGLKGNYLEQLYFFAFGIEGVAETGDVRVAELFHDLKLSVFVPFVLKDFFYCDDLARFCNVRLF